MGRTQPHGIAGRHSAAQPSDFWCSPPYVSPSLPARRPKAAQPGPRNAEKAVPGRFAPNCGEGTISAGRSLGLAQDFCGRGVQCGLASDPVAGRDRVEGGHGGWWGV